MAALRSLLVVRQGALVGERYYRGATADGLHGINSVTKSVTSMLVGLSLHQGVLSNLQQTVGALLPEAAAAQPAAPANAATLAQLLTGPSGLAYDYRYQYRALGSAADPVRFAQALPLAPAPASGPAPWVYNDAAVGLLSPILARAHGQRLDQLAAQALFAPLGIARHEWALDRAGQATAYAGLRLRPRDLAKLAWLMANGGRWGETQVLPATWVADSTRMHVPASWQVEPVAQVGYGYLWFTGQLQGRAVAWGWGYGAQFALLAPSLGLAVVTTATDPLPQNLPAQNQAVMALVARVVGWAAARA
ncbi:MAG: serine hydrolase domain-containing protein [Ramlibacter sp.]